ncbi:hypothetical protein ABH901_001988 [Mammaliicoccus lentus]
MDYCLSKSNKGACTWIIVLVNPIRSALLGLSP